MEVVKKGYERKMLKDVLMKVTTEVKCVGLNGCNITIKVILDE